MGKYFPLPDDQTLLRFLDDSEGLYALKRAEFYNHLLKCLSTKKNLFGNHLMKLLFSGNFLKTHAWPTNNSNPSPGDILVHKDFVALLKTTLSRMAGSGILDQSFVNLDFWRNWPKKFREARRYVFDKEDEDMDRNIADFRKDMEEKARDGEDDDDAHEPQTKKKKLTKTKKKKQLPPPPPLLLPQPPPLLLPPPPPLLLPPLLPPLLPFLLPPPPPLLLPPLLTLLLPPPLTLLPLGQLLRSNSKMTTTRKKQLMSRRPTCAPMSFPLQQRFLEVIVTSVGQPLCFRPQSLKRIPNRHHNRSCH